MADKLVRRQLDARFSRMGSPQLFTPPRSGWIRAIRQSLGMTSRQLGSRLRATPQAVLEFERSEARGAITLKSLEKVAKALDCSLVYALIPNRSLEETVRQRAHQVAAQRIDNVNHTMRLEDQGLPPEQRTMQIDDLADEI